MESEKQESEKQESETKCVRVVDLVAGGDGLGRLGDGRVVFIEGGVPGDEVELADLVVRKRLARARIGRLVVASPDRVEPRCPHFGRCGGCRWQHVSYSAQLDAKRSIVRDALARIGGIEIEAEVDLVASPDPYRYRARARVVEEGGRVGFRQRGTNELEAIHECPILTATAESRLEELCAAAAIREKNAAETKSDRRSGAADKDLEWEILSDGGDAAELHQVGARSGEGRAIEISVLGESLRASPGSFIQGNALLWDALATEVRDQALAAAASAEAAVKRGPGEKDRRARATRMVELYAGIGFFTVPLVRAGFSGVAVESGRSAVRDLRANLKKAGFAQRIEVLASRVERRSDWKRHFAAAELLVVDPPRIGLEQKVRDAIADYGPRGVIYVSCDPATLARDLRVLAEAGYRLAGLRAFDLFPQTPHVEVVARLERAEGVT